jgi:hypothetical protein
MAKYSLWRGFSGSGAEIPGNPEIQEVFLGSKSLISDIPDFFCW